MKKNIIIRIMNGFCCSIAITLVIQTVVLMTGSSVLLPEYAAHFKSELTAFAVQLLMIGGMSAVTSAGTAIFELKKIGLWVQSILFLIIMLSVWIPVACFAWGFNRYIMSMATTIGSIVVSYAICWIIQYRLCRRDIDAINAKLKEKKGE